MSEAWSANHTELLRAKRQKGRLMGKGLQKYVVLEMHGAKGVGQSASLECY